MSVAGVAGLRALVTGSATGIGRHIALGLAAEGAHVAFNYRGSREPAEAAAAQAAALGVRSVALPADCTQPAEVAGLVSAATRALGGLDILVNNVGEFAYKRLRDHTQTDVARILAGTVGATFHATMAALPHMQAAGFGRVVNLGAAGAEAALGVRREGVHIAGKAGVVALTRTFALEEARGGVTFNVVCPGIVDERDRPRAEAERIVDRSVPVGRPGSSEDVVLAVLFLCRRESSFINGACIAVTGGWQGYLR